MNNINWLNTYKKIGAFKNAKVVCPECSHKYLTRIDIPLEANGRVFERLIFCEDCNVEHSLTMKGENNYFEYCGDEDLSKIINVDELKRRYEITKSMSLINLNK